MLRYVFLMISEWTAEIKPAVVEEGEAISVFFAVSIVYSLEFICLFVLSLGFQPQR